MATIVVNCDGSANSFENNGNIRITYTAGNGSITITDIEGMRTDQWHSYNQAEKSIPVTVGGTKKTLSLSNWVDFGAYSSYQSWGVTDTTWTGLSGNTTVKVGPSTYWTDAAYYNKTFTTTINAGYAEQYFDLNGNLDGTDQDSISPMGTADVTIGGTKVLEDGTDYYTLHSVGASYTVNDIKANSGYTYTGESSYTGTIGSSGSAVRLTFTTNSYSLSYNANGGSSTPQGGTYKYNTTQKLASAISRANSDSNVTITITYNANNGSGAPGVSTGTAVNTTPYTFSKWALNSTSGTQYGAEDNYVIPAGNSVFYALWTAGTTTRKSNPSITLSSTKPTRTGYTFLGWSTNKDATTASYASNTAYTFSANTTLYAIWQKNNYTVTIRRTAGISDITSPAWGWTDGYKTGLVPYGTSFNVNVSIFAGYHWVNWTGTFTTTTQNYTFTVDAKNYDITANAAPNTYTVVYNANGGTGTTASSSHTYDAAKALTANGFTRRGYKFKGWSTSSTATTATYSNQQSVSNLTTTNGGTVTLYAVWELEQAVLYAKNNGAWVDGLAYVKINGAWVKAKQVYIKNNGAWVLNTMK